MTQSAPISLTLSTNCPIANCGFTLEWLRFFGKSPHKSLRIFLLYGNVKQCIEQIRIYILATQTIEQLISKVTLQKQRRPTHASYTSLGTQTSRVDDASYIRNLMSIVPIITCIWIVIHIFIGALEQLVRLDVDYR